MGKRRTQHNAQRPVKLTGNGGRRHGVGGIATVPCRPPTFVKLQAMGRSSKKVVSRANVRTIGFRCDLIQFAASKRAWSRLTSEDLLPAHARFGGPLGNLSSLGQAADVAVLGPPRGRPDVDDLHQPIPRSSDCVVETHGRPIDHTRSPPRRCAGQYQLRRRAPPSTTAHRIRRRGGGHPDDS